MGAFGQLVLLLLFIWFVLAIVGGAHAETSGSAIIYAWARTKVCPNLTMVKDAREYVASPTRQMRDGLNYAIKEIMADIANATDVCHPACLKDGDCSYLQERPVKPDNSEG